MSSASLPLSSKICISSVFFAIVAVASSSGWLLWRHCNGDRRKNTRQKLVKWVKVGNVKELMIYPIKSCQGISVEKAVLTGLGLKCPNSNIRDRDFLLVDGNGKQLTMVNFPRMALIRTEIDSSGDDKIIVTAPAVPSLKFSCPKANGKNERTCKIKNDTAIKVLDCGDEVATWFRNYLGNEHLRLCYYHLNKTQRSYEPYQLQCPQFSKSDFGSFHNATGYLMVAEESVDELNKYLPKDKQCTWRNFRPTILIEGVSEPFAEVNWSYVKIGNGAGNTILNVAAPCHRCPITTVDQEQGILSGDGEPLKTLRSLTHINDQVVDDSVRKMLKNRGIMGLRLGLYDNPDKNENREGAMINVGDPVYVALI